MRQFKNNFSNCLAAVALTVTFGATAGAQDATGGRANVSKTPAAISDKSKIAQMTAYTQARTADGTEITPIDIGGGIRKCAIVTSSGAIREVGVYRKNVATGLNACLVQPQVVTYVDEDVVTRAQDTFAAVSLDDGNSWRRTNLSHSADKKVAISNVAVDLGYGDTAKPVLSLGGRYILAAWTGKYCPMGDPAGLSSDLYQVSGQQGFVNYGEVYQRPEFGTRPFSCVYAARGTVDHFGNIVWAKDEQITSGRRDAYQLSSAVAIDGGFALIWQEDPLGLNPGQAAGPGDGMSGAAVNHKTDIWYSFIKWGDFAKGLPAYSSFMGVTPATPPEDPPTGGRPVASVLITSPVRLSDNAACRVEIAADGSRTHFGAAYCQLPQNCASISAPDENGKRFCVTSTGVPLDGNTGACRPNLFLQRDKDTGKTEAIIGYEETKGMGSGSDKAILDADIGKNVIYHHMADFSAAPTIQAGTILNHPELDKSGAPLRAPDGSLVYKNARRVRFVIQPKHQKGPSGTVMVILWKEGALGQGRPSDIMMRRAVNGYAPSDIACDKYVAGVCVAGARNVSASTYQRLDKDTDGATYKVVSWKWDAMNQFSGTEDNPYEDARAHRGVLRGDFLAIGFTWTPNWAAARNGNDVYDYYIRRSFTAGHSWANLQGQFENPRNVSNLRGSHSNSITAIEPRIVGSPNTILEKGAPTGVPDDVQNPMVFFTSFGTSTNPDLNLGGGDDEEDIAGAKPLDLFWSYTDNYGETYRLVERYASGTGTLVKEFDWLAKTDGVFEGEAQLRINPAGTRLSATWLAETSPSSTTGPCIPGQDSGPGSDICFRALQDSKPLSRFDANGDGAIDLKDWTALNVVIDRGPYNPKFDFNEDGEVNMLEDGRLWIEGCNVHKAQNPGVTFTCPVRK